MMPSVAEPEPKDPVLAALLKKREALLSKIDAKIATRKQQQSRQSRKDRNRLMMLIGIAYFTEAEQHPEKRGEIIELLNRAITSDKDRAFLKSQDWV